VPYRVPGLLPPPPPTWTAARVALVFEAVLDRVALATDRASSPVGRSTLVIRLLLGLIVGVLVGMLTGVVIVMLRR
jgi:hypothetical protein